MTPSINSFAQYSQYQQRVAAAIQAVADCFAQLDAPERAAQLVRSRQALESDTFKVLMVGEFKRGKSTVVNAMLGERILPAKVAPCTAVITRVKHGQAKQATLHHRDRQQSIELDLEADPSALAQYLVIDNKGGEAASDKKLSPFEFAEVFYPLDLLMQNVELVDSPGLNEHESRTAVTCSFFSDADAMVFVLSCSHFLTETECKFLDTNLANRNLKDVFFLCNRYDAVRDSPDDFAGLQNIVQQQLKPRVQGEPRLFFVTALEALAGRLTGQPELIEQSNVPEFMSALESFLTTERGRVKLATPIQIATHAIQEALLNLVPQREALFRLPLESLREKLDAERPRLEAAERQCDRAVRNLDRRREVMVREAQTSWRSFMSQLELGVEQHAQTLEISTWDAIRSKSMTSQKLASQLEDWVTAAMRQWEQSQLQPLLETHWRNMVEELDEQAIELMQNLSSIRTAFAPDQSALTSTQDVTAFSRVMGAGLGLLNFGAMIEGAALGVGPAVKGLTLNLATVLAMKTMALTLPVILPVVLGIGVARTVIGAQQTADDIRQTVVKKLAVALREATTGSEDLIAQQILESITPLRQRVEDQMNTMVAEIRDQVTDVIAERERTQVQTEDELNKLAQIRDTLQQQLKDLQAVQTELG